MGLAFHSIIDWMESLVRLKGPTVADRRWSKRTFRDVCIPVAAGRKADFERTATGKAGF